jgi:hypothetical protein
MSEKRSKKNDFSIPLCLLDASNRHQEDLVDEEIALLRLHKRQSPSEMTFLEMDLETTQLSPRAFSDTVIISIRVQSPLFALPNSGASASSQHSVYILSASIRFDNWHTARRDWLSTQKISIREHHLNMKTSMILPSIHTSWINIPCFEGNVDDSIDTQNSPQRN